ALHLQVQLPARDAVDPRAHDEYLRGRYYWNKRAGEDYVRALDHFQRALDLDPAYAPAYAGLADCYLFLPDLNAEAIRRISGSALGPVELLAKARAAAQQALEINPALPEAHTSLGLIAMKQWEWAESEREFRRAIELNPNYATAHHWYAE